MDEYKIDVARFFPPKDDSQNARMLQDITRAPVKMQNAQAAQLFSKF